MQKLFLTSSFSHVSELLPDFINSEEEIEKTVSFITTASNTQIFNFHISSARKAFQRLGFIVDEIDISATSQEWITAKLRNNNYIYISGGNTFYLLQELKKKDIDQVIRDEINKWKVYIWESAGSMILAPNIEYVSGMDDHKKAPDLTDYQALEIIDFYPIPHYGNFPFKNAVKKILTQYESEIDLYPISNSQVIQVKWQNIEILKR